jgi:hypothetical protein
MARPTNQRGKPRERPHKMAKILFINILFIQLEENIKNYFNLDAIKGN